MKADNRKSGFVLVEILIANAILSLILLSVISGVTTSIRAISGSRNRTHAMLIAKTKMNEFILERMRGLDLKDKRVEESDKFKYSRETIKFEHPLLSGPIEAKITAITVSWEERGIEKEYKVSYIYQGR